jgi:leucyl aminopeptidase
MSADNSVAAEVTTTSETNTNQFNSPKTKPMTIDVPNSAKHVTINERTDELSPQPRTQYYNENHINNNELHAIRAKEKDMQSKQVQRLMMQRNRAIERKKLSSAYAQTKTVVFPTKKAELSTSSSLQATMTNSSRNTPTSKTFNQNPSSFDSDSEIISKELHLEEKKEFDYGYHFLHNSGKGVSVARDLSSLKTPLHKEIIHKNTYFTPSLVELCAESLAANFERKPTTNLY